MPSAHHLHAICTQSACHLHTVCMHSGELLRRRRRAWPAHPHVHRDPHERARDARQPRQLRVRGGDGLGRPAAGGGAAPGLRPPAPARLQPCVSRAEAARMHPRGVCSGCKHMHLGLQPHASQAATACTSGCNRVYPRLQPHAPQARLSTFARMHLPGRIRHGHGKRRRVKRALTRERRMHPPTQHSRGPPACTGRPFYAREEKPRRADAVEPAAAARCLAPGPRLPRAAGL